MMKRFIIAALALAATLPAAVNVQAQDDDIYFSKKADKKAKYDAVYASAVADAWTTDANQDWNLDDYNRRGSDTKAKTNNGEIVFADDAPFHYAVIDEKGDTVLVPGDLNKISDADMNTYKIIRDTVVLIEQYHFSDLIRRFHNPVFGYYRYSPWYDVAFYDPFYWDFCYYDPWWYVTPSFGFHYGNWYGGWSYGYYTGWYGGWYSPFYSPMPHYHHYCNNDYYYGYGHNGPVYNVATGSAHRGSSRNNFGGHFAHRGGWKGDGGSASRMASASTNRSYRAENGARVGYTNSNGTYIAGPSIRGRNTVNGRLANSTMRSHSRDISNSTPTNSSSVNLGVSRGGSISTPVSGGSYSSRTHTATRYDRNSGGNSSTGVTAGSTPSRSASASTGSSNMRSRRNTVVSSNGGFYGSADNSVFRRAEHTYTPSSSDSYSRSSSSYSNSGSSSGYSRGNYSSGSSSSSSSYSSGSSSTRSYSSGSSSSSSSSSSSYSSGSSSSGGSYSRGGGSSHSSGSSHGRR